MPGDHQDRGSGGVDLILLILSPDQLNSNIFPSQMLLLLHDYCLGRIGKLDSFTLKSLVNFQVYDLLDI